MQTALLDGKQPIEHFESKPPEWIPPATRNGDLGEARPATGGHHAVLTPAGRLSRISPPSAWTDRRHTFREERQRWIPREFERDCRSFAILDLLCFDLLFTRQSLSLEKKSSTRKWSSRVH